MTQRERDERILEMLAARRSGETVQSIADRMAMSSAYVSAVTCAIRRSDENHVGRDLSGSYW